MRNRWGHNRLGHEMSLPDEEVDGSSADPDSAEYVVPPSPTLEPDSRQLQDLNIALDNTGHPKNADFARQLRRGHTRPAVASWYRMKRVRPTGPRRRGGWQQLPEVTG